MKRIAIIGMNNPYGPGPRHALWPEPEGSSGCRLWRLTQARTGATQMDYARAFHRYNLIETGDWKLERARENWAIIQPDLESSFDCVLLLGACVRDAAGLTLPEFGMHKSLATLPHPSGLNRWYNDPINRQLAELLMEELYTLAVTG